MVLGVLTGERAHAAENTAPTASAERVPPVPANAVRESTACAVGHLLPPRYDCAVDRPTGSEHPARQAEHAGRAGHAGHTGHTKRVDRIGHAGAAGRRGDAMVTVLPERRPRTGPAASAPASSSPSAPAPSASAPSASVPSATAPSASAPALPTRPARSAQTPGRTPGQAPDGSTRTTSPDGSAASPLTPFTDSLTDSLTGLTDGLVRTVTDTVVRPVGDLVVTVTTGLTQGQPSLPPLPSLPTDPGTSTLPLPTVPDQPGLPGLPVLPGRTLPAPVTPVPDRPDLPATAPASAAVAAPQQTKTPTEATAPTRRGPAAGVFTEVAPSSRTGVHDAPHAAQSPAHRAPTGDADGALNGRSAVDGGSSRHGDAQAVTPSDRLPLRLLPGATASVDAAGTRDRHRDIPVFPG
ncbi:hypothetical protein GCM10010389_30700 [Streptomyces echinoruber]|uniref:Uncharacterized protein n=2 Tax=Streptomyces echinoruber TaxID=68898 RepID=A0A918VDI9_9ACTN|nr:hypothetical protein GCM10010389_30700 [Streptomyces echinoruber]